MNKTQNLELSLYESSDKFTITASEDSLNHNMELIDTAITEINNTKIDKTQLDEAVNSSLAEAKASGEFKGDKGETGTDGKDGISITITNVSESTSDGGSNTITFSDGKTLTVKNGSKGNTGTTGEKGADGYTPVRGTDYWTELDKELIIKEVVASLGGTPVFGVVDNNNNITISGILSQGTYTLKYEFEDGSTSEIGTIVVGENDDGDIDIEGYVNQIPISTDAKGHIYNTTGYKVGYRIRSSGEELALSETATNPAFITGFIPAKVDDVIELKNCFFDADSDNDLDETAETNYYGDLAGNMNVVFYNSSYNAIAQISWIHLPNGNYTERAEVITMDSKGYITKIKVNYPNTAYIRCTLGGNPETAILTVNQEIPKYINIISLSRDTDGTIYNNGLGYKTGYRLNSSGGETAAATVGVTGFIPIKQNDVVRFDNIAMTNDDITGHYIILYDSAFNMTANIKSNNLNPWRYVFENQVYDENGNLKSFSLNLNAETDKVQSSTYMRISCTGLDEDSIITINEEITD